MSKKELLDMVAGRVIGLEEKQFPSGMDRANIGVRNEFREHQSKELEKLYELIKRS